MPADSYMADDISVETDENGFELHITTEAGLYVFNVHAVLGKLLEEVTENLLRYLDEGDKARIDWNQHIGETLHSVHADLYDSRKEK